MKTINDILLFGVGGLVLFIMSLGLLDSFTSFNIMTYKWYICAVTLIALLYCFYAAYRIDKHNKDIIRGRK